MNLIFVNFILNLDRNSVFPCLELVVVDTKTIFERRILESCNKAHIFHFPGGSREDILVDIFLWLMSCYRCLSICCVLASLSLYY